MFQLLYELGQTVAKSEGRSEIHDLLKDPIADEYKNLVEIQFDSSDEFVSVVFRRIDRNEKNSLLYKSGPPNGFDATALSKFAEDPTKTTNRVRKAVAGIAKQLKDEHAELKTQLTAVAKCMESNLDPIANDVKSAVKLLELDVTNRGLLSVSVHRDGNYVPVWSLPEVASTLVAQSMVSYGKVDTPGDSTREDAICCICKEVCDTVFGNFSELKTYNLDKPGMIAGGFVVSQTVNNFPVCPKCAATLSLGISAATTLCNYKMAGQPYLILPQCFEEEVREHFLELAKEKRSPESLREEDLNALTEDESEILRETATRFGTADQLSLKFVFFESDQQSWKIKGEVDQVLPSQVAKIFNAKKFVEQRSWCGEKDFVSMSLVREFAGGSFMNSRREFLAHVDAIFSGKQIDEKCVLRSVVDQILIALKRDEKKAGYVIKRALLLFDFYKKLEIIPALEGHTMNTVLSDKSCYGRFIDANPDFFGSPRKRLAFLTGALVKCVMNAQYEKLKSTPFSKKLRGMRITDEMLRRLLSDSKEKLRAYEADQFALNRDLIELICEQWVAAATEPPLSVDETTFLFTVGMSLEYHVRQEFGKQA